jgi:alpha-amylase
MKKILLVMWISLCVICMLNAQTIDTTEKGEVIYHVFQRSFYDSNGDRHGDLNGLREKLDYLQDLGITAILLMPLYEAECYHNYFASDFEKIDPEFGTMEDYIALVKDIHKRGMKIYMDMETQYVTSDHIWWKKAVGNPKSPFSDFLLFEDEEHKIPATIVFDLRALNSYDGKVIDITTVNLKSPWVLDYNKRLFSYFLDPNEDGKFDDGVDGYRLDHAMDNLDKKPELTNLFETFWSPLISHVKEINPKVMIVAEQADWGDIGFDYFERAGVDRVFGFGLKWAILTFDKEKLTMLADTILMKSPKGKEHVIFIENHDIDRLPSAEPNLEKRKLAAALMMTIGGIPSIYYGQEIGMTGKGGNFGPTDGNDIPRREAFEWHSDLSGIGMATWYKDSGPWWDSTNIKANDGISLQEQIDDPNSLFNYYKKIIKLRRDHPAVAHGAYSPAINDNPNVFSFYRTYKDKKVLVIANLSAELQKAKLDKTPKVMENLFGKIDLKKDEVALRGYEVVVVEL